MDHWWWRAKQKVEVLMVFVEPKAYPDSAWIALTRMKATGPPSCRPDSQVL